MSAAAVLSDATGFADDDYERDEPEISTLRRCQVELLMEYWLEADIEFDESMTERAEKFSDREMNTAMREVLSELRVEIPMGTEAKPCFFCGKPVYWVPFDDTQYNVGVSLAINYGVAPTATEIGIGVQHLVDCPKSPLRWEEK